MVDILPLGSGDPHIFAEPDPDPGSQNLSDPTDPDPDLKYWFRGTVVNRTFVKSLKIMSKVPLIYKAYRIPKIAIGDFVQCTQTRINWESLENLNSLKNIIQRLKYVKFVSLSKYENIVTPGCQSLLRKRDMYFLEESILAFKQIQKVATFDVDTKNHFNSKQIIQIFQPIIIYNFLTHLYKDNIS